MYFTSSFLFSDKTCHIHNFTYVQAFNNIVLVIRKRILRSTSDAVIVSAYLGIASGINRNFVLVGGGGRDL